MLALIFNIRSKNLDKLPREGPLLILAPHVNFLDPVFLLGTLPRPPRFIADSYFARTNVWLGWILWLAGVVLVWRDSPDAAGLRRFLKLLASGECCMLFPEGARSPDGQPLAPMKQAVKMADKLKVPVAMISIKGAYDAWPRWDPRLRIPRGRLCVEFCSFVKKKELWSKGNSPERKFWWQEIYNWRQKTDLPLAQNRLHEDLRLAATGESGAIDLERRGRPPYLTNLLSLCPACSAFENFGWDKNLRQLKCEDCGLALSIQKNKIVSAQAPHEEASIDIWFKRMLQALWAKDNKTLIIATQAMAKLNHAAQTPGSLAPASLRIDGAGFALRLSDSGVINLALKTAAHADLKGSRILQLGLGEKTLTIQSPHNQALAWLLVTRRLAGWKEHDAEK